MPMPRIINFIYQRVRMCLWMCVCGFLGQAIQFLAICKPQFTNPVTDSSDKAQELARKSRNT